MADTIIKPAPGFFERIFNCARDIIKPAFSTISFLLLIMLPVSFAVLILESTGLLYYVSKYMNPLMQFLGLPGEAALAYLSAVLMNLYSAIAVIKTISLTDKQLIILSTMCMIAHNFFVECLVMKKTGSHLRKIVLLRLFVSLLAAWILKKILPPGSNFLKINPPEAAPIPGLGFNPEHFFTGLGPWLENSLILIFQIFLIVFAVMFLQRILAEFKINKILGKIARPIIWVCGLSPNTAYVWIIANTVGVVYDAGVIMEEVKAGNLSRTDADIFNHHASINHSQIEDTFLFVSLGVTYAWAALPRFILAILVVWVERVRRHIFRSGFRVKVV
jgi:spore maturation protein SpmB